MKKALLFLCLTIPLNVLAQWLPTGATTGNIYYNNGDVGIGASPLYGQTLSLYREADSRLGIITNQSNGEATLAFRIHSTVKDAEIIYRSNGRLSFNLDNSDGGNVQNNEWMTILNSGNIGMGTITPYSASRLHMKSPNSSVWGLVVEASSNQKLIGLGHDGNAGFVSVSYLGASSYSPLNFNTSNLTRMSITADGQVGIGTTTPGNYKLAVEGKIGAREVVVTTAAWADYVFEPEYRLRPLSEVECYIKENKHLPEIPSTEEVKTSGHKLGEMDVLLLKKIEELTLYVIELEKKNKILEIGLNRLEAGK